MFLRIPKKHGGGKLEKLQNGQELSKDQTYEFQGITFLVQPVFREQGERTLGTALIHLMQSEAERLSTS